MFRTRFGGHSIAKTSSAKSTHQKATPPPPPSRPRSVDPEKAIAVNVAPDLRGRSERVWSERNRRDDVKVSKSEIYRAIFTKGLEAVERELGIA